MLFFPFSYKSIDVVFPISYRFQVVSQEMRNMSLSAEKPHMEKQKSFYANGSLHIEEA